MRLINLNNKLLQIRHKITKQQFKAVQQNTKLSKEELVGHVKADLIQQLVPSVLTAFQIEMIDDIDNVEFRGAGYVLSERDMINTIKEILELDGVNRDKMLQSCDTWLGIR